MISAPPILEFDLAWSPFDVNAWGHFDVKLCFNEILGAFCAGHLTSPEKKWAPVAIKIFYKYGLHNKSILRIPRWAKGENFCCVGW